uniref:Rad50_1 protein n=1 Tax=Fopius arisanus TaxID=64838 RepID=A0A0C9QJL4_9HYME
MSKVRKLSIRGIRNFSDVEESTLQFSCPLTLITGLNGVGKTTVIECLRYITTGELPPNSDKGKAFVHDPMLKKQASVQVRGCVRAQFDDREGKTITVTRTMECSRYKNQSRFKTLDGAVVVYNPKTKKETQLTNRCADLDVEVMHALGVSKAILNHVIFCHQDDANWPLDENKVIKERFDAILETTNYNKALETLRKLAKTKGAMLKVYQVEEQRLADRVADMEAKEAKLADFKKRRNEIIERMKRMNSQVEPVKERLEQIRSIEAEFQRLKAEDEMDKVSHNMAYEQCESLQLRVKEIYEGSDDDLWKAINSYDSGLEAKNWKIGVVEREIKELLKNEQNLVKTLGDHRVLMGTLKQQVEDQKKKTNERNQVLNSALTMWGLDTLRGFEDVNEIQKAVEEVEVKTQKFERSISNKRLEQNQQENGLEKIVDAARDKRSKINSELKRSEEEAEEIRSSIYDARLKIGQGNDSEKQLDAVDVKLVQIDQEIEEMNELMKSEDVDGKIAMETSNFERIEEEFTKLDEEMTLIQNQSALNAKLESLKANFQAKSKDIEQLKSKHEVNIKKLLKQNEIPEFNLKEAVEEAQKVLSERLEIVSTEIKKKEYELMTLETALTHAKQELKAKIANNDYEQEKVMVYCEDYNSYPEVLENQQKKLKELQDERGIIAFQGSAYNTYIRELNTNSWCGLCERHFDAQLDSRKLMRKLESGIANNPDLLKRCERKLKIEQENYNTLLSLKSTVEAITKFELMEKANMTKKIKLKELEVSELKGKIEELKESKLEPERSIEMVKSMIPDLSIWDRYSQDLMGIDMAMDELREEMSTKGCTSDKTMEEIQTEREALKKSIKVTRDKIDELRSILDSRKEQLRRATEKRTKCLEEQLRIHNEAQQLRKLKNDLNDMIIKEKNLRSSIQTLRQQLITAEEERTQAIRELDELKCKNREEQENDRKQMKNYEKQWDTLNSLQMEITLLVSKNVKNQLQKLESEVKRYQEVYEEDQSKRSKKESELIQIKEDISCYETKQRNLTDNVELRKYQKALRNLEDASKQRKMKINRLQYDQVIKEQRKLFDELQEAEGEVNKASGIRGEIEKNIDQLTAELNTQECRTARTVHRSKSFEVIVTTQAINDVMTYTRVLDRATAEFHEERLNKINSAMKKLWKLIYSGNDTKSIQIRAEATSTTGATERRQFNYKLVQVKHGIEMEMRGRCSAGQRVLASIILRLALAQTLSQQCGILALDEPTTNLDSVNSAKLADALYRYVTYRAQYEKNFQLIVITHDEEFIRNLNELGSQHSAQELYRKDNGLTSVRLSTLTKSEGALESDQSESENDPATQSSSRKRAHPGDGPTAKKNKPFKFDLNF